MQHPTWTQQFLPSWLPSPVTDTGQPQLPNPWNHSLNDGNHNQPIVFPKWLVPDEPAPKKTKYNEIKEWRAKSPRKQGFLGVHDADGILDRVNRNPVMPPVNSHRGSSHFFNYEPSKSTFESIPRREGSTKAARKDMHDHFRIAVSKKLEQRHSDPSNIRINRKP